MRRRRRRQLPPLSTGPKSPRMSLLCHFPPSLITEIVLALHEVVHDVHGHGEDDGRVVLRRDAVQRLKVAELQTEGEDVANL